MLTLIGFREEYNGLKANLLARVPPVSFNELHGLLCDHDYVFTKMMTTTPQAFLANTSSVTQSSSVATPSIQEPNIDHLQQQLQSIQLMATHLGYQLNPIQSPRPQAHFGSRSFNNNRGDRGSRGSSRGNSRGGFNRSRDSSGTRQFSWASTQNTVYGHCNRCGIGYLPSQCPAHSNQSQPTS